MGSRLIVAVALAAAVWLGACGASEEAPRPGPGVTGGSVGPETTAGGATPEVTCHLLFDALAANDWDAAESLFLDAQQISELTHRLQGTPLPLADAQRMVDERRAAFDKIAADFEAAESVAFVRLTPPEYHEADGWYQVQSVVDGAQFEIELDGQKRFIRVDEIATLHGRWFLIEPPEGPLDP